MNMIRLIAWREYMENVKTKGFWVGILIFPLIFTAMYFLQTTLSNATPTRYYILIDQSGKYEQAVETAIERDHQRRILQSFVSYLLDNRKESDLNLTVANPNSGVDQFVDDVDADEVAALEEWLDSGGLDFALTMASPNLEEDAPPFVAPEYQFIAAEIPTNVDVNSSPEEIAAALRPYLRGDSLITVNGESADLFALILIPENVDNDITRPNTMPLNSGGPAGIQYWARNLTDSRLPDAISISINSEIRGREYQQLGVDNQLVRNVQRTRLPLSQLDPTAEAGEEAVSMADTFRQFAPIGFVYLMFVSLMQSVQYLLSNTIEEKSNRIIEVLLASVTAGELMMGKLVGIGMSGLTTIAVWLFSFYLFVVLYDSSQTELISQILEVVLSSDLIPWFVFYYFAGYALYSGIFLAIGSLCNTLKEAQALMMPMIMIQIIPIAMMAFVVLDPNNTIVRAMSWFPLFTPYLMMNRAAADPPMIDVVGTTILLILSIIFVLWFSGKVFRMGVLRTGQPPKMMEIFSMMRSKH
ncbi:MAG: ABC transporter permease [Gammaproteobacteria bacterium]|jgi:ABC-2 type transport system permease protein|nr:ABC transporter permease [Gammaproteobacteria bacterium]MBT3860117.1 ABC transporter permease [Gammaproteobacteria bacterium]MBT3987409.1 ABC transporter permease [Gammaproteobacteria bacterium]MBT4581853.1 ABC transporter permease [Gammaproteobacteria bacterium]MBT4659713.1 ABC transporter permease [Gammaproteobacteria bacterium]